MMGDGLSTKGPIQGGLKQQMVRVSEFEIDATVATAEQFAEFIQDSKYVTDSETFKWSFVLDSHATPDALQAAESSVKDAQHWLAVPGASWQFPRGPGQPYTNWKNHPVTHISYRDAVAFCKWRGEKKFKDQNKIGRLPTETEWEYAARGGLPEKTYPWGDGQLWVPGDGRLKKWRTNIWQGSFPKKDAMEDGYSGTCPVNAFEPNGFGLYNVIGNVWEWTDTPGPKASDGSSTRVLRGGSFLDSADGSFNHKVTVNARMTNTEDSASSNTGVRCVYSPPKKPGEKQSRGYVYPKEKPRLDQDILSKIAEEGGIEALQEYLGDTAQVTTPADLKKRKEELEKLKKEL
jgi:sulfatase modifying factor 1